MSIERAVVAELSRQQLDGAAAAGSLVEYFELLGRWSARIRLTASADPRHLVERHLPDALAARRVLGDHPRGALIDAGSGGGLPAIPLLLLCPELEARLVEANQRKCAFLRTAVAELALKDRVTVVAERIDSEAASADAAFDLACSRATWAPDHWLSIGAGLVRAGGGVLVFVARDEALPAPGPGLARATTLSYELADGTPRVVARFRVG